MTSLLLISPRCLTTIAFLASVLFAPAASIAVDSYSYLTYPTSSDYQDSGWVELTDGITYSQVWTVPSSTITLADVVNLVGWQYSDPAIRFDFATAATVGKVTVWAADSDGSAGVDLPVSIVVRTPDNSFIQTFAITNPAGNGTTVPLVLSGFSVNTSSLIVEARVAQNWVMLSEVQFDSVPEASTFALVGVALAGLAVRRRVR